MTPKLPEFKVGDIVCEKNEYELWGIGTRKVPMFLLIPLEVLAIENDDNFNEIKYKCKIVIHPRYDINNEEDMKELQQREVTIFEYQIQLFSNVKDQYLHTFENYTEAIKKQFFNWE